MDHNRIYSVLVRWLFNRLDELYHQLTLVDMLNCEGAYLIRPCALDSRLDYDCILVARLIQFCEPHWYRI